MHQTENGVNSNCGGGGGGVITSAVSCKNLSSVPVGGESKSESSTSTCSLTEESASLTIETTQSRSEKTSPASVHIERDGKLVKRATAELNKCENSQVKRTSVKHIVMDFDCSPAEYISSFKSASSSAGSGGQLVEEESLIHNECAGGFGEQQRGRASKTCVSQSLLLGNEEPFCKASAQLLNKKEYQEPNDEEKINLNLLVHTKNIVAAIDPTFQSKLASLEATSTRIDFEQEKLNRARGSVLSFETSGKICRKIRI